MDHADAAAEKCGDVLEMWLGLLDIANLTKGHIQFMDTRELLAGLEASIKSSTARLGQPLHRTPKGTTRG
jgi:hypothetical protein